MFTIQRFFLQKRLKKSVHCSGLGGVHLAEVYLQPKSIGRTETCVQIGGVHYREVFINRGFTVIVKRKINHITKENIISSVNDKNV